MSHMFQPTMINEIDTITKEKGVTIMLSGEPHEGTHNLVSASVQRWIVTDLHSMQDFIF